MASKVAMAHTTAWTVGFGKLQKAKGLKKVPANSGAFRTSRKMHDNVLQILFSLILHIKTPQNFAPY